MGVRSLRSSISLSVILHLLFLVVGGVLMTKRATDRPAHSVTWIEVEPLKKNESARKQEDLQTRKQIVQTEKGQQVAKPAPDSFLSEHNQTVDRETVNKNKLIEMGKGRGKSAAQEQQQAKAEPHAVPTLRDLGIRVVPKATATPDTAEQAENRDRRWADTGGNLPQDYVKGLKESERTALNTREFVFYSYFQRIRARLDQAWVPILRQRLIKLYFNGRQLASDMEHTTKVKVVLNGQGEIIRVEVLSESGTHDLDEAAVSAFNEAGPFPNPPHGIAGLNGLIEIPWEFILRT
jgi:protein TonB